MCIRDRTYDGHLNAPTEGSSLFTVGAIQQTGSTAIWQHSSAFDANSSLLYLPRVNLLNVSPPDTNEYDVYFRLNSEDGVDGLEFIEFEIAN